MKTFIINCFVLALLMVCIPFTYTQAQEQQKFELRPNSKDDAPVRRNNSHLRTAKPLRIKSDQHLLKSEQQTITPNQKAIQKRLNQMRIRRQAAIHRSFRK
jgi:hypothetical protein